MDADRQSALRAAKLAALVRVAYATDGDRPAARSALYPGGAALVVARLAGAGIVAGATTPDATGYVYADERPLRSLGGALAWAAQQGVAALHLVVDEPEVAGHLARRATYFASPAVRVSAVDGRVLHPVEPAPAPVSAPQPIGLDGFVELIRRAGADPVVEHGVLSGEVYGLEVCRVVFGDADGDRGGDADGDADADADDDDGDGDRGGVGAGPGLPHLEVGVGAADREMFRVMYGDPTAEQIVELVHRVSAHRRPGAEPHALNRLGAERRLRQRIIEDPTLVGARSLAVAPSPLPRANLKDPVPCVAVGIDGDGASLVAVCASGVDLDAVPVGADARAIVRAGHADRAIVRAGRSAVAGGRPVVRLAIVTDERDRHPALARLAATLHEPAEVRPVRS